MLWLALHFPDLALQVFAPSSEAPFAVGSPGQRPAILAVNGTALALGVRPGMAVSAARALAPGLILQPRNPRREAEALDGIATWALQFTPDLSLAPPEAVLLEIGGCLKLFGSLARLLERVRAGLLDLGLEAMPAVAPTPDGGPAPGPGRPGIAAWRTLAALRRHLAALPLDCLDQARDVLSALAHLGLRTLGDCMALPRAGLARRFGPGCWTNWTGPGGTWDGSPDPVHPAGTLCRQPGTHGPRGRGGSPAVRREAPGDCQLCGWLAARNAGVRRLTLALAHERRVATAHRPGPHRTRSGTAPTPAGPAAGAPGPAGPGGRRGGPGIAGRGNGPAGAPELFPVR
jgi:protein ImuB